MSTTLEQIETLTPPGETSLFAELKALGAIVRKEWNIFRRYPSVFFSIFVWPVIFPLIYILMARALAGPDGSGLAIFNQMTGTQDYIGFIVIGTSIWMWQNIILWNVGYALRTDQRRGTLEHNWLAPTWRFSHLLGNGIVHLGFSLIFLLISSIEYGLFFGVKMQGNPLLALLIVLISIPSIYGIGFTFASLVIFAKEANAFVYLVRGLVMIFCGVSFPVLILPGWMQMVAKWLPPTYIIAGFRKAILTNASLSDLKSEILPLLGFGIFWLLVSYLVFQYLERRTRQAGMIGTY